MRVHGIQFKVTKDDRVMCEKLDFEVGQQIEIDDVLLIGTKDYTCIGRPNVTKARVLATVEETSQTEKVWIFKKRRRHGNSQRHRGHRQWVTVLRIDKIIHDINETTVYNDEVQILTHKATSSIV
jgi:large subunit ribosomal protein L21